MCIILLNKWINKLSASALTDKYCLCLYHPTALIKNAKSLDIFNVLAFVIMMSMIN